MLTAAPAAAAYPGENGLLVWSSNRGAGNGVNLFTSNADGSNVVQLTFGSTYDVEPVWSPGGQRIAFTRYSDAQLTDGEIYVVDADGSDLRRVTNSAADDFRPSWSPDANLIAFTSNRVDGSYDLYTVAPDGTALTRRTTLDGWELDPAWNPHDLDLMLISYWPTEGTSPKRPKATMRSSLSSEEVVENSCRTASSNFLPECAPSPSR